MPDVDIVPAAPHQQAALQNLFQLYTHDFTEHWAGQPRGELDDDGRFQPYPLDAYWRDPAHIPLLLRVGGHLAGFALLDNASQTGQPLDRNVAEFFVVRKHRRGGVGTAAAHAIFSRYPGRWEIAVTRRNTAALAFWRRVVAEHPRAEGVEEVDVSSPAWNGPVLRFRIGPKAS